MMNEASLLLLCVFSVDRFIAVSFPLHRVRIFTTPRFLVACICAWMVPLFTAFYPFIKSGHYYYSDLVGFYVADIPASSHVEERVSLIVSNIIVILPFSVTIFMCLTVIVKLARREKGRLGAWWVGPQQTQATTGGSRLDVTNAASRSSQHRTVPCSVEICSDETCTPHHPPSNEHRQMEKPRRRDTKEVYRQVRMKTSGSPSRNTNIVIMMIGFYIVCLLPGHILNLYNMLDMLGVLPYFSSLHFLAQETATLRLYLYLTLSFSTLLFTINSSLNPFLYYLRSDRFTSRTFKVNIERLFVNIKKRKNDNNKIKLNFEL